MEPKKINGKFCSMMPCCGIFAGALISGREPQEIFDAYKAAHNKTGNWKGSTRTKALVDLMQSDFGVRLEDLTMVLKMALSLDGMAFMTVKDFYLKQANRDKTYLVYVRGHVMVIDKGRLIDQWHCEPVIEAKKNRCKVTRVYEVISDVNIPEGKISGFETNNELAAEREKQKEAKIDPLKRALWKGLAKYGLSDKIVHEYKGQKMRLYGYNARAKRYPFLLEIFEDKGKPCSQLAKTDERCAIAWFSASTQKAA